MRVFVVGDSLTAEAQQEIEDAIADSAEVDGAPGATIAARLDRIREVAREEPRVVVVALGTNDGFFGSPAPGDDAEATLEALDGVDCVRWIGVAGVKGKPALVNVPIAEAVARHRNAEFVDWASVAEQRPEWHQDDGVHHTAAGKAAFAQAIADAVRSCGRGA